MRKAQQLDRPIPLVCEDCGGLIGADEQCTWRERTPEEAQKALGLDSVLFIVPGVVGKHELCPKRKAVRA